MITRTAGSEITAELVASVIAEHDLDLDRLDGLMDYFRGDHDIVDRTRTTGLPNNLLVHGYPHYIAVMTSGYLVGDPVQYTDNDQPDALEVLQEAYKAADVQSIDAELALQAAIYGRGVELCYADKLARPKTAALDPTNAFVVYDNSVEHEPMFGVHRIYKTEGNEIVPESVTVYTATDMTTYTASYTSASDKTLILSGAGNVKPHQFGAVPMVEYWNNSVETGDFEGVISLVDAYDLLQSDRVNDKQQFTDALLVLTGISGFAAATDGTDTRTPGERLREDKTLSLPDKESSAQWLTKTLNEADTDVLRQSLKNDIHKFAMVPDLTDENFAGNSSGVAMKYKLLGLEQLTKIKERWFREALRERLRLFANFLQVKGAPALDPDAVQMTFARSLPVNDLEIAQTVQTLKDIVPDELLMAQVPFVQDVSMALESMQKQRREAAAVQQAAFGAYADANDRKPEDADA